MQHRLNDPLQGRRLLMSVLVGGFLLLAGAPQLRAMGYNCRRNVAKADHRLHEAIEEHGYFSRQANHWRHELAEARRGCWAHGHRWWDEDGQHWRSDHDWDDHDHDRNVDRR